MKELQDYIKKCRKAGINDETIKSYLEKYEFSASLIDEAFNAAEVKKNFAAGVIFGLLIVMIGFFGLNPQFIGFVTSQNTQTYTDMINVDVSRFEKISWTPEFNGEIYSVVASGKIVGEGKVKVYLKSNDARYLLFDRSSLEKQNTQNKITGMSISDFTSDPSAQVNSGTTENPPQEASASEVQTQEILETDNTEETRVPPDITPSPSTDEIIDAPVLENNSSVSTSESEAVISENNTQEINLNETSTNAIVNETPPIVAEEENSAANPVNNDDIINETIPESSENISTAKEYEFNNECFETCQLNAIQSDKYTLEFEVEDGTRVILDSLRYTVKNQIPEEIIVNTKINETLENDAVITSQTNYTENVSINEIANQTISVAVNETINTTINASINVTETYETTNIIPANATVIGIVEIEKPVLWRMAVDKNISSEITLPKETFNITLNGENARVRLKGLELSVEEYNIAKESEILKKDLGRLQKEKLRMSSDSLNGQKGIMQESQRISSQMITKDEEIKALALRIALLRNSTKDITIDQNITLVLETNTTETTASDIIRLAYYTEGPSVTEEASDDLNKRVTVSSDIHYQNIKAYTDIRETQRSMISLYYKSISGDVKINNVDYVDTNNNGLIDRLEWIVPHTSNETYTVNISVLNLQSYPTIGGNWVVEFVTTGVANLTITADNGTAFGVDLVPVSLKCGDTILSPVYDGNRVFYENYECNSTGYHTVKVLTTGVHNQKFEFGDAVAYAHNLAGALPKKINLHGKLLNSTGGNVNETVAINFSIYDVETGGTPLWNETQTVDVVDGVYTAILGTNFPITLNFSRLNPGD